MRTRRHPSAWSAAVLPAVAGANLLASTASRGVSDTTCSPQLPLLASLGVHLDVLAESRLCPEHSYLPGSNYGVAVQLWVLVSTSTLVAGAVGVLMALGAGLWTRRAPRKARDWLRRRLPVRGFHAPVVAVATVAAPAPQRMDVRSGLYRPLQRRGPPSSFC